MDPLRLRRAQSGLVVVDIQERLLPAMFERERVLENSLRLVKGAIGLKVPVVVTEQYPKGIGHTMPELAAAVPGFAAREKATFSSCGAPGFLDELKAAGVTDVVVCGIESHVCVTQTALDLLVAGLQPFVVADAVSSRTPENWRCGIERLRDAGAVIVSTEMVLFELLGSAGTAEFKQILTLVK
jgi:nicotinamidase-related amidase